MLGLSEKYPKATVFLHWIYVLAFLITFLLAIVATNTSGIAFKGYVVFLHYLFGMFALVLAVSRIAIRNSYRRESLLMSSQSAAARVGHNSIYILIVLVPVLGLFSVVMTGELRGPFQVKLPIRAESFQIAFVEDLHAFFAWLLVTLVTGHIAVAFWRSRDDSF